MKNTVVDFWRLVWQEHPQIIVMVANLIEGGKSKCEQYWPASGHVCENYGPFTVRLMDDQVLPDIIVRSMRVWVRACLHTYMQTYRQTYRAGTNFDRV